MLSLWFSAALTKERGIFCDAFNYFHSSHLINSEQAFGILLERWDLFSKPLCFRLADDLHVFSASKRLQNFAVDEDGARFNFDFESNQCGELCQEAFNEW